MILAIPFIELDILPIDMVFTNDEITITNVVELYLGSNAEVMNDIVSNS